MYNTVGSIAILKWNITHFNVLLDPSANQPVLALALNSDVNMTLVNQVLMTLFGIQESSDLV